MALDALVDSFLPQSKMCWNERVKNHCDDDDDDRLRKYTASFCCSLLSQFCEPFLSLLCNGDTAFSYLFVIS